jgi:hypothetical protein
MTLAEKCSAHGVTGFVAAQSGNSLNFLKGSEIVFNVQDVACEGWSAQEKVQWYRANMNAQCGKERMLPNGNFPTFRIGSSREVEAEVSALFAAPAPATKAKTNKVVAKGGRTRAK